VDLTIPSFGIQEENDFPPGVHDLMPGTLKLEGCYLYGNEAPGLGIDIGEEAALRYPPSRIRPCDDWTTGRGMDGSLIMP
jgi:mannonate dehydratase